MDRFPVDFPLISMQNVFAESLWVSELEYPGDSLFKEVNLREKAKTKKALHLWQYV